MTIIDTPDAHPSRLAESVTEPSVIRRLFGLAVALIGTSAILGFTLLIGQIGSEHLGRYALYQAVGLAVTVVVVIVVSRITRSALPKWGDLRAPARRIRLLALAEGESWFRAGVTFTVLISLGTATYLGVVYGAQFVQAGPRAWLFAFLAAIPLSLTNAFTEELITRWAIVASMPGSWARFAPWVSAAVFGGIHWFGVPGGPVGAIMAGFLGWLLARSIQDTRGVGWAWIVHFCQDVLIFTVTIALFI